MEKKELFYGKRRWLIPFFLIGLMLSIFIGDQIATSSDASASKKVASFSAYAPPPNFFEIQENVEVVKNLRYSDTKDAILDIYYPKNQSENMPVVLWIHGGGYIGGSKDSRQDYAMTLADGGYVVANINYALAPEQKYPGPIFQANEAIEFLMANAAQYGGDMERLFIGGDSAGAQISSQVAAVISNAELAAAMNILPAANAEQLKGAVLFCGLYDMDTVRATQFPNLENFLAAYTGTEVFESFERIDELSTVNHITEAYPPVFMTVGDADPFVSQSEELKEQLLHQNVPVESLFFEGSNKQLKHEYQYALDTEEAQEALKRTLNFLFVNSH
ncbi:alpha/beta hydrolase [Planococcus sp. 107-1]|uniref:alpha/beta hydrolase n=1 Tax=Planococcus sp. 107-1 TaxID=2908840 RepID=UPI001F1921A9|nr:alpha/beta hydrolase [Planococcus sp. 107-1]UJF27222.1 alpha/beta hydrolase [Planococcus sp. 107-1]